MKKLMKKKVSLMGREFSVFAIAVVAMMALASAALVPYLSNVVSGDVDIASPITLKVLAGDDVLTPGTWVDAEQIPVDGWVEGDFPGVAGLGGASEDVWFKIENNAENYVDEFLVLEFKNTMGISEAEVEAMFTEIVVYDWDHANMAATTTRMNSYSLDDAVIEVNVVDSGNIVRVSAPLWLWEDDDSDTDTVYIEVKFDFPMNAYGNYEVQAAVLIDRDAAFTGTTSIVSP